MKKKIYGVFNNKHKKNFKKINESIDYSQYSSESNKANKPKHSWLIPVIAVCLTLIVVLPLALKPSNSTNTSSGISEEPIVSETPSLPSVEPSDVPFTTRLTTPKTIKIKTTDEKNMSVLTYNSYTAFTNKFVKMCFEVFGKEESLGVSIPDAYICFAITILTSNDDVRNELLSFLELNDIAELKVAVKEIVETLCCLYQDEKGNLSGGYNLNSVWLNPEKVDLLPKDESLYNDLEEIFDASLYLEPLTSSVANDYLKENGLDGFPTPEIKLNDDDPAATANMSVYYCLDSFLYKDFYEEQYKSQNHKMTYTYGDTTKEVDYITSVQYSNVYLGDNFVGSDVSINRLGMSYFLPNENVMPSEILDDVLEMNYTNMKDEQDENKLYNVLVNQPYFKLENEIKMDYNYLNNIFPCSTEEGVSERIVSGKLSSIFLSSIIQQSVMTFDYNGFYSCSVTIISSDTESGSAIDYELNLSRPYLFKVTQPITIENNSLTLPLVIGEIVNPNYE